MFGLGSKTRHANGDSRRGRFRAFVNRLVREYAGGVVRRVTSAFLPVPLRAIRVVPSEIVFIPVYLVSGAFLRGLVRHRAMDLFRVGRGVIRVRVYRYQTCPFPPRKFCGIYLLDRGVIPRCVFWREVVFWG